MYEICRVKNESERETGKILDSGDSPRLWRQDGCWTMEAGQILDLGDRGWMLHDGDRNLKTETNRRSLEYNERYATMETKQMHVSRDRLAR